MTRRTVCDSHALPLSDPLSLTPVTGGSFYGGITAGIARELAEVDGRIVLVQTLEAELSGDGVDLAPDFRTPAA